VRVAGGRDRCKKARNPDVSANLRAVVNRIRVENRHARGPQDVNVNQLPDWCPVCRRGGRPDPWGGVIDEQDITAIRAVMLCPLDDCQALYLTRYILPFGSDEYQIIEHGAAVTYSKPREFPEKIRDVSPAFVKIYNQALQAEKSGLTEICGAGYRRALEFLVKDFVINHELKDATEAQQADVLKAELGTCINNYIKDEVVQSVAARAAWLGNDATHYVRIWEEHDLEDLKTLIDLTMNSIQNVLLRTKFVAEMAKRKKVAEKLAEAKSETPTG
jgi:hypothetical protein